AAGFVRLEQRRVRPVPVVREVESPLLHPALPVLGGDFVGHMEDAVGRVERRDGRRLVGHTVVRPGDAEPIRREAARDERILLVLHDHEPTRARIVEQPAVARHERRVGLVGAAADHDRVVVGQVAARERIRTEQLDRHAYGLTTTWAVAGPAPRLVTVIVKWPAPPPAGRPSIGHTMRSGVTATSNGWVTKIGRRTSPIAWSR